MGEAQLFNQLVLRFYFNVLNVVNNVIVYCFKDNILQLYFFGAKILRMQMGSKTMAKLPSLKMRAVYIPTRSVRSMPRCALPGFIYAESVSHVRAGTYNALSPSYLLPWSFCTKERQYF